ncbi:DUF202 domain-containing protein [Ornithinimicrobium faecis]|uniref:DUF202 domain-containing protein n=1 Tax=Ornithinimicrobium faecis TaxID=2934158 RepID=UPI0021181DD3|nr:DUF202 domain-containing protein [Ornithinimicrobium sp. HY1745]
MTWRPRPQPRATTAADLDRGLQPERTTLGWSRTSLALVTVSAIFLRWAPHYGLAVLALPALTLVCALAISVTHNRRINTSVRGIHSDALEVRPGELLALVALLLAVGGAGLVLVLLAP